MKYVGWILALYLWVMGALIVAGTFGLTFLRALAWPIVPVLYAYLELVGVNGF